MNGAARMSLEISETSGRNAREKETNGEKPKLRVHVSAEDGMWEQRLLRAFESEEDSEADREGGSMDKLTRMENGAVTPASEILVMYSTGGVLEDLKQVRQARKKISGLKVLLVGAPDTECDFLQYVRAGVNGFRPAGASEKEIAAAARAVCSGQAVCGNMQCEILFRYVETEGLGFPSAAVRREIGFTRREQQLVPLLTRGMTNKEIANHFSLSEQTVKNHLYRMKRKSGAGDRLEIVDICRQRGFLA